KQLVTGGTGGSGITISIYGWFFEQMLARQGALYANNGNGRDRAATEVVYNREEGQRILDWWARMVKAGIASNPGRWPAGNAAAQRAFSAGQTAMIFESTATLRSLLTQSGGRFEVGTGYFPKPPRAADGGSIVGGASVWILRNRPPAEQRAAWEFVKFITAPPQQAAWYAGTGYFPIRKDAYRERVAQETLGRNPQFLTAISELRSSPINRTTQGALLGVFPEARQRAGAYEEHAQLTPQPGWVEHDPEEIWQKTDRVIRRALAQAGLAAGAACRVAAVGVTNQRETSVLWDRRTGRPLYRAIVWQDTRTRDACRALIDRGLEPSVRARTGLPVATYFSALKAAWILDHVPGVRAHAERGDVCL